MNAVFNGRPIPATDRLEMEKFVLATAMALPEQSVSLAELASGHHFANQALGELFDFVVGNNTLSPVEILTSASQHDLLNEIGGIAGYGKMYSSLPVVDIGTAKHYASLLGSVPIAVLDQERETEFIRTVASELTQESRLNDIANAERFIDRYHQELLFVPQWKRWLSWDGCRWVDDSNIGAMQRAERYAKSLWNCLSYVASDRRARELEPVVSFIRATNQLAKMRSFLELASCDERVVCRVEELNTDPNLFNCPNGTIDLTTGRIRQHSPADRITQLAKVLYKSDAQCPKWIETLNLIFQWDKKLIRYVQQLLGYSLSGETGEHLLPIAHGLGANGKSTIWNCQAALMGDYAELANDSLLMGEKHGHPTEKASLYQKRFVPISEPEKGAALKESRVKELTGDRTITARRMHEDFWSFERTHTFWLSTNHLPRIRGTDEGIWRRVKLIPFGVDLRKVTKPIPDFDQWLVRNEGSGILNWLIAGYLDYRANGLVEPEIVSAATSHYRGDSEPLADFLDECCVIGPDYEEQATKLFAAYQSSGGRWSKTAFGRAMGEKFQKGKAKSGPNRDRIIYRGVKLFDDEMAENTGFSDMGPVGTSRSGPPREKPNSMGGPGELVPTRPNVVSTTECFHEWGRVRGDDGRLKEVCTLCGKFYGFVREVAS